MGGTVYAFDKNIEAHLLHLVPEEIPEEAWQMLGLKEWEQQPSRKIFDEFQAAYSVLFHHIDHMADFSRCSVDLDSVDEEILQEYLNSEQEQTNPLLQKMFDSFASLMDEFPELDETLVAERTDIIQFMNLIVGMKDVMFPSEDFEEAAQLTITEIGAWRDRLKTGFELLGQARCLWLADSLGLKGFDYPVVTDYEQSRGLLQKNI